jgi:hypothetical protein
MKELLINNLSTVEYTIYVDGVATNADGSVTAKAFLNGAETGTTLNVSTPSVGKYKALVPISMLSLEGEVRVEWAFLLQTNPVVISEYYDVVTPYAPWSYFQANTTYSDFLECERIARKIIDWYCGQSFGKRLATYGVEGSDMNGLRMPRRLITLTEVRWNDVYTNPSVITAPSPYDGWVEYTWELVSDGWILRTPRSRNKIDAAYPIKFSFKRNTTYNVEGLWGWNSVPTNVEEAAKIIIANLLCKDQKYRDKYLESIATGDWDIKFMREAFAGTGSVTADQLLSEYRMYPGIGVI